MDHLVVRVVLSLCEDIGTPRALAVKLLVQHGEWAELQRLRCRPRDYADAESYWKDSVVTDLLRKCDLATTADREGAAVQTFLSCEAQNCATNARLSRYCPGTLLLEDTQDIAVSDFIGRWRKDIASVLGNLPDHLVPRFSPGATFADTGFLITTPDKMSSIPTVYEEARCLLPLWGGTGWFRALAQDRPDFTNPRSVRGNVFFCVPKDGITFRGCCKEASIPVAYQLDVGRVMKLRLQRINIDLREGQQIHQRLARDASISGSLATIDMSNASDTVCRVLPELVLPTAWFELLNSLRAPFTKVNGKWYRLEKFSSMGNGFTFELETLIFATLARTVILVEGGDPDSVRCYGDDLIIPTQHTQGVLAALRFFGFTPNDKKTFAEGPFRESCGGDFWGGVPVRAHFLESLPDEPQHWISLANGLRRSCGDVHTWGHRWPFVRRSWLRALDPIPSHIRRCRGPDVLGDVVIHDTPDTWRLVAPPKRGFRSTCGLTLVEPDCVGYEEVWLHAYLPVPKVLPWHHWIPAVQLACCTLGLPSSGVTPRDQLSGYRIGVVSSMTASWTPSPS